MHKPVDSTPLRHKGPKPIPVGVRVWRYIARKGPLDCWLWTGSADRHGNPGSIVDKTSEEKRVQPRRLIYEQSYGRMPDRSVVRMRCRNPRCLNPAHMMLGRHGCYTAAECIPDVRFSGRALQRLRRDARLTQADMAQLIEVTPDIVHRWEVGHTDPSATNLLKIMLVLVCAPSDLAF
jgi:DNA-binding transcriptional regulator YiaG